MATSGSKSVTVTSWDTLRFTWEEKSQSIPTNTTTITWKLQLIATSDGAINSSASKTWTVTINGTQYTGTNTVGIGNNSTKTLASGTTTIGHNADGTKTFNYSFSQQFDITFNSWIGTISGSGSGTLDTIPRKSSLTASNGTLGTAQTLTISRNSASFTHTITYKCGTASGTITTKTTGTSVSWTPALSLASQNTTGTSVSVTLTLTTYSGSTEIGTASQTITCAIPSSVAPTCTVALEDVTEWQTTYGSLVQGLSRLKATITPTLAHGSPIASYTINANGTKYTAATATTGVLRSAGTNTISATVKDKRGRSGSVSRSVSVLAYTPPSISAMTVRRCDQDGTENDQGDYIAVVFSATVTSLNSKNTASYKIRYKKSTAGSFTEEALTSLANNYSVAGRSFIFAADGDSSYTIEVEVKDRHNTATRVTSASTAFTLMNWGEDGTSMGIGKVAEEAGVLDIGLVTRHSGGLLPPVLPPGTDLNNVRTPNTYVGANLSTYNYLNCPLDSGTFTLEVMGAGETDQVKQRIQSCGKTGSRALERYYYSGTWGAWFCVSDYAGTLLWEGEWYMQASQTATLSEAVSKQKNGIVLVFTEYISGASGNSAFHCFFVPKMQVQLQPDKGHTFTLATGKFGYMATKYLYISDTAIRGHADNNTTGTGTSGITYTNNRFILRYVIGV